jgi:hypothetical protein
MLEWLRAKILKVHESVNLRGDLKLQAPGRHRDKRKLLRSKPEIIAVPRPGAAELNAAPEIARIRLPNSKRLQIFAASTRRQYAKKLARASTPAAAGFVRLAESDILHIP